LLVASAKRNSGKCGGLEFGYRASLLLPLFANDFSTLIPVSGDCQDSNFCAFCMDNFCVECKDGYDMGGEWVCIDCLRKQGGLLDLLKSEQNEAEGNMCANCFLSEDDMEGVTLKRCANCKTTKYCSRACQKAHWKEHRDQCHCVSEKKIGAN
jgi:hypothetical protein